MQLKILKTRDVIDQRQRRTLVAGEVAEVVDPVVIDTLLAIGAAVRPGDPEPVATATEPEPDTTTEEAQAEEPAAEAEAETKSDLTWDDIPGISDASRAILAEVVPEEDPAAASPEQVEEWLGSKQRAVYVKRALDDYFGRES